MVLDESKNTSCNIFLCSSHEMEGEGINQYCSIFVLSGVWVWRGMERAEGAFLLFTSPQKSKRKDAMRALDSVAANVAVGSLTTASFQPPPSRHRGSLHRFRCFVMKRNINAHQPYYICWILDMSPYAHRMYVFCWLLWMRWCLFGTFYTGRENTYIALHVVTAPSQQVYFTFGTWIIHRLTQLLFEKKQASFSVNLNREKKERTLCMTHILICSNDGLSAWLWIQKGYWNCRNAIGIYSKRASEITSRMDVMRWYK